ncbi:TniQ family protein [Cryobacterium sp. TMT1-66-1]|uniref:TniQ family protein n=1 Tax=Cryobacterium sp. TMT1-66-1 TaxID=1259242 RepID=UPI00106D5316|nr:TniQ family protein [Cryobacterium sp. TMT1-66-1]TFD07530.1 hypothetical protein E3T29_06455 [Cryobacterium sp. TMT1-66-1]
MRARIGTPIRLGVPVDLYPGEWLHSAISRWAWQTFAVSRAALFNAFGLAEVPHSAITALGTRLLPEIAANISYSTGITERRLRGATMESLDEKLLTLNGRGEGQLSGTVSRCGTWSWQAGTRYCPDCLHDHPGVFQLRWRSPWAFACTTHRRILLDACPWCQGEVVEMRGRNTDLFDPSTCRANTAPEGATRRIACRAKLEETWDHFRLKEGSAPMLAQRTIFRRERAGISMQFLRLLQAAATGLRGAKAFDEIGLLSGLDSGELRGLFDDEKHVGISAPKSAYAMAGLAGAAFILTHAPEADAKAMIRRASFSRPPSHVPRGAGYGPGSPLELLTRWPDAPEPFRAQILRAHDQDLTISQRILWDTAVDPITLAVHRPQRWIPAKRWACIPEQLWPAWCSRFDVGGKVDGATLARALAHAVRVAGTSGSTGRDEEKNLAAILRPNMLGTSEETHGLLAGISELAHTIDDGDFVIDYPKRTDLPATELLPRTHWELLADSVFSDPGTHRRLRNARRYLWQRITAAGVDKFPDALRIGLTRDDSAEYTNFCTRMTAELQNAFDRYGQAFLRSHGSWEPVTWTPDVVVGVGWPGTEITDLDVDLLHTMLLDGLITRRRLAETLRVSSRQVLRAIDAAPPATGRSVRHVDWQQLLPPRLPESTELLTAR